MRPRLTLYPDPPDDGPASTVVGRLTIAVGQSLSGAWRVLVILTPTGPVEAGVQVASDYDPEEAQVIVQALGAAIADASRRAALS
jgi:hypothetical protein